MQVDPRISLKEYINSRNYRKYADNMRRCKQIRQYKGLNISNQQLYTNKKQLDMQKQLTQKLFQIKVFVRQYIIDDRKFVQFEKMINNFTNVLHLKLEEKKKQQMLLHNVLQQELSKSQINNSFIGQRSFRDFDGIQKKSRASKNSSSQDNFFLSGLNVNNRATKNIVQNPQDLNKFQIISLASNEANDDFAQQPAIQIKLNVLPPTQKKQFQAKYRQQSKRKQSGGSQLLEINNLKVVQNKIPLSSISSGIPRQQNKQSIVRQRKMTINENFNRNTDNDQIKIIGNHSTYFGENKPQNFSLHNSMAPSTTSKFSRKQSINNVQFAQTRKFQRRQTINKKRTDFLYQNADDQQWINRNKQFDDPMKVLEFFGL